MIHWSVRFETARPLASMPVLKVVTSETISSFSYRHEGKDRQADDYVLFKHTISGEGMFSDAKGEYRVPEGHGFLCHISDPATAYYYPKDGTADWKFVYLCATGNIVKSTVEDLVKRYGPIYRTGTDNALIKRMMDFRRLGGKVELVNASEGAALVYDLFLALAASKEEQSRDEAGNLLIRRAREMIFENLGNNINATDIAQALQVSREHLTRLFREQTGTTPYHYIRRQKMRKASRLLKETNLTSKEIAVQLGYPVPAHFARTFKSIMHMTPTRFRELGVAPVI